MSRMLNAANNHEWFHAGKRVTLQPISEEETADAICSECGRTWRMEPKDALVRLRSCPEEYPEGLMSIEEAEREGFYVLLSEAQRYERLAVWLRSEAAVEALDNWANEEGNVLYPDGLWPPELMREQLERLAGLVDLGVEGLKSDA